MPETKPPKDKVQRELWALGFRKRERRRIIREARETGVSPVALGLTIVLARHIPIVQLKEMFSN